MVRRRWIGFAAVCLLVVESGALSAEEAARKQIYEAVQFGLSSDRETAGAALAPGDLNLSGAVPLNAEAGLELSSASWDAVLKLWIFHLRCRDVRRCIPFVVTTRLDGSRKFKQWDSASRGGVLAAERELPSHSPAKTLLEAGQSAKVVLSDPTLRIRAEVVCLERGRPGQWIRVRGKTPRARVFRALVLDTGLLSTETVPAQERGLP
jgi:hypothetical protein